MFIFEFKLVKINKFTILKNIIIFNFTENIIKYNDNCFLLIFIFLLIYKVLYI